MNWWQCLKNHLPLRIHDIATKVSAKTPKAIQWQHQWFCVEYSGCPRCTQAVQISCEWILHVFHKFLGGHAFHYQVDVCLTNVLPASVQMIIRRLLLWEGSRRSESDRLGIAISSCHIIVPPIDVGSTWSCPLLWSSSALTSCHGSYSKNRSIGRVVSDWIVTWYHITRHRALQFDQKWTLTSTIFCIG